MTEKNPPRDGSSSSEQKPAVPLEKIIDQKPHPAKVEAGDRVASEAAKAPAPEIEAPDHADPERDDSVADLVENDRRQRS